MPAPYYAAVTWPDGSRRDAVPDSPPTRRHGCGKPPPRPSRWARWCFRSISAPKASRPRRLTGPCCARRIPRAGGSLYAARVLCAADRRNYAQLVDRRLTELDIEAELVDIALAARIVATARHDSMGPVEALHLEIGDVRWHKQHPLEIAAPDTVAAEVNALRRRAHANPSWWASLWQHMATILHGHLLASLSGDARARSPTITERLEALEGREHH